MRMLRMKHLAFSLLCTFSVGTVSEISAEPISLDFNGTKWILGSASRDATSAISEFAPQGEKVTAWSRLLTFQHFPDRSSTAQETVTHLFRSLKADGRGLYHDLILVDGTPEAYLAYIAADSPADPAPEFTLYKFGPDASGTGVVILQISEKMRAEDRTPQLFAERQKYWMQRFFTVNLDFVRSWFVDVYPPNDALRSMWRRSHATAPARHPFKRGLSSCLLLTQSGLCVSRCLHSERVAQSESHDQILPQVKHRILT